MGSKRVPFVKLKQVVLYCRVASDNQHDTALEAQAQSLRQYAEAQGHEIVKIIQERGTGTTMDRSGIRVLYMLAGRRAMDEVLAKSISRYTRGPLPQFIGFIEEMAEMGVTIATEKEGFMSDALPALKKIC